MSLSELHPHRRSSSQGRTAPLSSSASLPLSSSSRTPLALQSQAQSAEPSTKVPQKLANMALDPVAIGMGQKVLSGAGGGVSASGAYKKRRVDGVGEKGTSVREDGMHGSVSVKEQLAAISNKVRFCPSLSLLLPLALRADALVLHAARHTLCRDAHLNPCNRQVRVLSLARRSESGPSPLPQ